MRQLAFCIWNPEVPTTDNQKAYGYFFPLDGKYAKGYAIGPFDLFDKSPAFGEKDYKNIYFDDSILKVRAANILFPLLSEGMKELVQQEPVAKLPVSDELLELIEESLEARVRARDIEGEVAAELGKILREP